MVDAFWQLVYYENVTTVMMLVRTEEVRQYFPLEGQLQTADMTITLTSVNEADYVTERLFSIQLRKGKAAEHIVRHFQFKGWPDLGVPVRESRAAYRPLIDMAADFVIA